jgi:hypothetical protein
MKAKRIEGSAASRDPTVEAAYWEGKYSSEPYYQSGYSYDDYSPAYRTGFVGRNQFDGRRFEEVERELEAEYNRAKGASRLKWEHAKHATRAAWERADRG